MSVKTYGAADHTLVVDAVVANMREIVARIRPTPIQILRAALEAPSIDADTRRVIRGILAELPALEQAERLVPPELRARTDELVRRLADTRTPDEARAVLDAALPRGAKADSDESGWATGVRVAIEAVEHGRHTIYAPGFVERSLGRQGLTVRDGVSPAGAIVGADAGGLVGGAVAGAISGSVAGGAGALPGAVVGAVAGGAGSSVAAAVSMAFTALFDR